MKCVDEKKKNGEERKKKSHLEQIVHYIVHYDFDMAIGELCFYFSLVLGW